jgi:ADP-ribose pyrophosphatase
VGRKILEIPAGTIDGDEEPEACARRELSEETGFSAAQWKKLGAIYLSPGVMSEKLTLFEARELTPGPSHPEGDEDIDLAELESEELIELARSGRIEDAKTFAALFHALDGSRRP